MSIDRLQHPNFLYDFDTAKFRSVSKGPETTLIFEVGSRQ